MKSRTREQRLRCSRLYEERQRSRGIRMRIYRLNDAQKVYTSSFVAFLKDVLGDNITDYVMDINEKTLTIKFKVRKEK